MGLFDGAAGPEGRRGATADLAAHFRLPVVLVIDVAGQAQSAAAVVRGFAAHDAAVQIAGVILNRVAGERHRMLVADAIAALGVPVLGALPRDAALALPERHLGLVQAREHPDLARADRSSCRHRRAPYRPRRADRHRRAVQVRRNNERRRGAAAAGPAHRARQRPRLQLRLSAPARGLAPGRRRNRAVLAARRRAAAGARRQLLAPRRLPGIARRRACRRAQIFRRIAPFRRDAAGSWRVRRLHGARREVSKTKPAGGMP